MARRTATLRIAPDPATAMATVGTVGGPPAAPCWTTVFGGPVTAGQIPVEMDANEDSCPE